MKKFMKTAGFIVLCVFLFLASTVVSFLLAVKYKGEAPYQTIKVKEDRFVWTVSYDLDSDGKESTKYDLYLPAQVDPNKEYPMIFYIHGGGFTGGDKSEGKYCCPYYAANGMIAVSANYTLSNGDGIVNLNTMHEELCNTMRAAKDHCAELGYNITEMATTGVSAGGCLALLCAYREPENLPVPIRFVFEMTGPASFEPEVWGQSDAEGAAAFVSVMTGKTFGAGDIATSEFQNAIDEISPAALVDKNTVPTILAYGPRDTVVPANIKYLLLEALDEYHAPYDYIEFPNSGHGLLDDLDKSEEFYRLVDTYIERYFESR